jgi:hypothetical protein
LTGGLVKDFEHTSRKYFFNTKFKEITHTVIYKCMAEFFEKQNQLDTEVLVNNSMAARINLQILSLASGSSMFLNITEVN